MGLAWRFQSRWEISKTSTEGNYCIRNQSNGYAMDVLYGTMEDGQHVVSYEYNGGVNQQWQFIQTDCNATQVVPDGYYEIKSAVSGKDLEVLRSKLTWRRKSYPVGCYRRQQSKMETGESK